jgi:endonuclease/exonuclease/phosphatase family metal-dependent hydrolase
VGGISSEKKYDIRDLFTQNIFYKNNKVPDIIIIGLQEIVELDIYNILSITTNEESVSDWTKNIISTLNSIFPYTFKKISVQNLVGIYYICLAQSHLKDKIEIIGKNVIKTGLFGTLGNKGYLTLNLNLFKNTEISFAVGHLEAGKNSNDQRISTLKQILNTKIGDQESDDDSNEGKKFKNSDFWIILGDLNFRIETTFEKSFEMIQRKEYQQLMEFDQLYLSRLKEGVLVDINESQINFPPTYKYITGSNNYVNDIENLRTPSWTDRILFCHKNNIRNLNYSSIQTIMYSDHRPVQAAFEIDIKQQNIKDNINLNQNMNSFRNNNNNFNPNFGYNNNNNVNYGNSNYNMNNQNNFGNNNYNTNNFRNINDFNAYMNNYKNNYNNNQ